MKIHYLQHVPFEGPANIATWAQAKGHTITGTPLFSSQDPPAPDKFDWLVVMGGPMNIYEEKEYPWLAKEKKLIELAIQSQKTVLGICLGAQLIADALGGKVYPNQEKEIGWFPVTITNTATQSTVFTGFPQTFTVFHWHGDTFHLPPGAVQIAQSTACPNQAFLYNSRVIGLQFHLESTPESIALLIKNCSHELIPGPYIQPAGALLPTGQSFLQLNRLLYRLLDQMEKEFCQ